MSCDRCDQDKTEYREATWAEAAMIAFLAPPTLLIVAVMVSVVCATTAVIMPFAALLGQIKVSK